MPANNNDERRQFYRVSDRVGIEFRRLEPDSLPDSPASCFDGNETMALQEEMRRVDHDIRAQLNLMADSDRTLAHTLKLMNQKLDAAARIMTFQQKSLQDSDWQNISLSEGGLSFLARIPDAELGTWLALRLTMKPELAQVAVFAEVVDLSPARNGDQVLHVQYRHLEEDSRQQIARHVLQVQTRQRQQERVERDGPD